MQSISVYNLEKSDHLSFLRARDPSILSGNFGARLEKARTNLLQDIAENESEDVEDDKYIQIYLRIKYVDSIDEIYKIDSNTIHCSISTSTSHSNKSLKDVASIVKKFTFTQIYQPATTQEEIFNMIVKPKVFKFINGENSTLMSYGASGSGKTFTIVGTVQEPGIIPRTLEYLFRTLPQLSEVPLVKPNQSGSVDVLDQPSAQEEVHVRNRLLSIANQTIDEGHTNTYREMQNRLSGEPVGILDNLTNVTLAVWVSFSEIYNENIYDLLTPIQKQKSIARPKLKLASFNENTYIRDLTNVSVSSGIEAYQILQYGLHNLQYASTSINPHSSRSHCIFTIRIAQVANTSVSRLNYFNFCDLAGSERLKKTLNVGDRLKESNKINTSLLVLGRCISCIRENQKKNVNKMIPYRESKLTRLFQRALSGNESICMIVNMNPAIDMFEESLHALNFSAIAKDVVVKRTPLKLKTKNRFSTYLQSKNLFKDNTEEEAEETEVTRLHDIIDKLYTELENLSRRFVERESKIREEVIKEQDAIIDDMKQYHQKQIAAQDARHQRHIEELRDLFQTSKEESEVINISSSSDEEDDMNKNRCEGLHQQSDVLLMKLADKDEEIATLKNHVGDMTISHGQVQQQIDTYKAEVSTLKTDLSHKENEITDLKRLLNDAEVAYREMQSNYEQQMNDLVQENYKLTEDNSELLAQVEQYSKMYLETD
ncbi:Kinesin [Oryctes borbonicus]|uniref:Kinesin n=1 Tax=Oryctes borbonicus TaxID=1629725 RepID=A0A0T6ATQ9_9SCAR|nr:Kinesin [Oryctes borbonicus]